MVIPDSISRAPPPSVLSSGTAASTRTKTRGTRNRKMPDKEPFHFSKTAEELIGDLRGVPYSEPRRQKIRPTHSLASVVDDLVSKYQIGRDTPEQTIRERWTELVGAANAAYSHAARLE